MSRKTPQLLIATMLWAGMGFAQSLVNATGTTLSNSNLTVEYSVGEVAIATITASNQSATQGLLQPSYQVMTEANEAFDQRFSFSAFPNPVGEALTIETDYGGFTDFRIYASTGQLVQQGEFSNQPLEMTSLRPGTYLVQLIASENNYSRTIKIIKQ